jgi:type I restriction enzyme, S subunit
VSSVLYQKFSKTALRHLLVSLKDGTHGSFQSTTKGIPLLSAKNVINGQLLIEESERLISEEDFHSIHKSGYLKYDDVLLTIVGTIGRTAIFNTDQPVAFQRSVAVLRPGSKLDNQFLYYAIQSSEFQAALFSRAKQSAQSGVYLGDVGDTPVAYPKLSLQKSIAHFLDRKTAAIDTLIAKKQRLIQLLEEKRTALINQAVTKGLNPNAPMKDSGIPWIGEIPQHWEVRRLKFAMSHTVDCLHSTPTYEKDGKYPAIRTANISPGELNIADANRVNDSDYLERIQRLKPQVNDIIYSREGERYGMAALVPPDIDLCLAQRVMMFRVNHHQNSPHYIMWALNASCTYHQIRQDTVGATSPRVNIETIKEAWLPIPPYDEQVLISRRIFASFEIIRRLTSAIEKHIEKLQEYRRSLITAAVTGKLDISEVETNV